VFCAMEKAFVTSTAMHLFSVWMYTIQNIARLLDESLLSIVRVLKTLGELQGCTSPHNGFLGGCVAKPIANTSSLRYGSIMKITESEIFSETEWEELLSELSLSPRQAQVVKCLLSGYSDKQIAFELRLSKATVRTHMERLFGRLGVQDRTELVLHVFRCFRQSCRLNGCLYQDKKSTKYIV